MQVDGVVCMLRTRHLVITFGSQNRPTHGDSTLYTYQYTRGGASDYARVVNLNVHVGNQVSIVVTRRWWESGGERPRFIIVTMAVTRGASWAHPQVREAQETPTCQ